MVKFGEEIKLSPSSEQLRKACCAVRGRFPKIPVIGIPWLYFTNVRNPVHRRLCAHDQKWVLPLMILRMAWPFIKGFQTAFKVVWLRLQCRDALAVLKNQSFDVVAKTWVFGGRREAQDNDFYYGDLQTRLADNNIAMLLLCGNVSGRNWRDYVLSHTRTSLLSRLPELCFVPFGRVFQIVFKQAAASFVLWFHFRKEQDPLLKRVLAKAAVDVLRAQTLSNSLYYWMGREAVKIWKPRVFLTFYEGYAWEKCLWLGVREEKESCKIAGYQHTVIMKHAYEQLAPLLGPNEKTIPDIVLCSGLESLQMMESGQQGVHTRFVPFGSFRFSSHFSDNPLPVPSRRAVLIIPEGNMFEATLLFDFAIKLSALLPQYRLIFRSHPLLPFDRVRPRLSLDGGLPPNVEISNRKDIHDDFSRASAVLYRGSSAVMYAILKGLKPFYLQREGEAVIDPLFKLKNWREPVDSLETFVNRLQAFETTPFERLQVSFQSAAKYVRQYIMPVDQEAVGRFVKNLL